MQQIFKNLTFLITCSKLLQIWHGSGNLKTSTIHCCSFKMMLCVGFFKGAFRFQIKSPKWRLLETNSHIKTGKREDHPVIWSISKYTSCNFLSNTFCFKRFVYLTLFYLLWSYKHLTQLYRCIKPKQVKANPWTFYFGNSNCLHFSSCLKNKLILCSIDRNQDLQKYYSRHGRIRIASSSIW